MQLILGFLFLLAFFYLLKNFMRSSKASQQKLLIKIAIFLATGILILLVITGRIHILAALGAGLLVLLRRLPLLLNALPLLQKLFGQKPVNTQGDKSTLETSLLNMTLDHDSGEIDGTVMAGKYTGRQLSRMDIQALTELHQMAVARHPDAVEVLETYFERVYGEQWYEQFGTGPHNSASASDGLSSGQALDILGLQAGASEAEIISAHRKMMQKFHPDRGGSNYLAAKVNEAKDVLLSAMRKD